MHDIFYNQMQQLEKEPGCEEDVLQELLTLASAEGLVLPLRAGVCDGTDSAVMSTASLHAVMDSGDQVIVPSNFSYIGNCLRSKQVIYR